MASSNVALIVAFLALSSTDALRSLRKSVHVVSSRQLNQTQPEHHDADPDAHGGSPGEGGEPMVPRTEEWTYKDTGAWAGEYGDCAGDSQSPINLKDIEPHTGHDESDKLDYNYHPLANLSIDNNGHNIQVNGNFGVLRLPDGTYQAKQLSFHCPSEHEVDDEKAECEMHIVHQKEGSKGTDDIAIIGILFKVGDAGDSVDFLKNLGFGALPKEKESKPIAEPVHVGLGFATEMTGDFYHYQGSLTTPPCSQKVHWFIPEKFASVSQEMVDDFKSLFPDGNSRPIQERNGRQLKEDSFKVEGESYEEE